MRPVPPLCIFFSPWGHCKWSFLPKRFFTFSLSTFLNLAHSTGREHCPPTSTSSSPLKMPNNRHGSLLTSSHTFLQKWVFASDTFSGKVIGDLLIANSVDMSPSLPSWSSWHICYKWPLPPFSFSAPDTTTSLNILSKNSCGSILSIAHILESLSVFLFHSYSFSLLDIYLHLHLILYLYFSSPNS